MKDHEINTDTVNSKIYFSKDVSAIFKSSPQCYSIKKAVLKNFAMFTGKCLCWSLFLIKLQA